jgi:PAS domain S-box-containing protein
MMRPTLLTAVPRIEGEAFLSSLVRSSNDAIIGKTTDGIIVLWNAAAERLYGYAADEMIGREVSILIPPNRPGELANLMCRAQSGETVENFSTERLRKDGTVVSVSITVTPVVDLDGTVLGMATIAHDLTGYKRQMEDLREAHRRADETLSTLETLHGSAPVGLGFVDREFRVVHLTTCSQR